MCGGHVFSHLVDIPHVQIVIAVIAHEDERVLPGTGVPIGGIGDSFIDERLGIGLADNGKSSHGQVELVDLLRIGTLSIIEKSKESVVDVTFHLIKGVLALVAQ